MRKTVLAYGELLWDILPTETMLGGAVCNFIYRINALGYRGLLVSRLGRDELGEKAFECVWSLKLDTKYLQWDDDHPTGTVPVSFDENNNPSFVIIPDVAYDYIEMTDSLRQMAPTVDCLCFGTLSQRAEKSRETLRQLIELCQNSLKLLDINLRKDCYNSETVNYSLEKADILKLNEDELYELADMLNIDKSNPLQICNNIIDKWSIKYCVVTLGEKGAFAVSDEGDKVYDPGYKVDLGDPIGAGDAFSAGFVYQILKNASLAEACQFGNILGALVSTTEGASAPVSKEDVDSFMDNQLERIYDRKIEKLLNSAGNKTKMS
jgi:fructokinase